MMKDMPKLESPFVRTLLPNGDYIVTPEISPGYEWVFEDESVMAIEKLHGTNVSVEKTNYEPRELEELKKRITLSFNHLS